MRNKGTLTGEDQLDGLLKLGSEVASLSGPVGAAISNAVYDAVGARVTQLPITPERLFSAMHTY